MCYVRTVTHREMRNNSGEILRAVASGETVQVTNNGRIAAVISPPGGDAWLKLLAGGAVRPARRPPSELSKIPRRTSRRTSSAIIADTRGDW